MENQYIEGKIGKLHNFSDGDIRKKDIAYR